MTVYVEPKTGNKLFLTHAEVSAVLGETAREARERVWLQQAIDAYLGASQKYTDSDAEVISHSYNAFVRQMSKKKSGA